jgi:hypothetical protein
MGTSKWPYSPPRFTIVFLPTSLDDIAQPFISFDPKDWSDSFDGMVPVGPSISVATIFAHGWAALLDFAALPVLLSRNLTLPFGWIAIADCAAVKVEMARMTLILNKIIPILLQSDSKLSRSMCWCKK